MKILIAAGGSGGHIFPAVALARALLRKGDIDILFIGGKKELDRRIFEKEGFKYRLLSANKLTYKNKFLFPVFFLKLLFDLGAAFSIIKRYRPSAVVGFGGYISCPAVIAGRLCKIPCVLHEQNVVPGRANKFLLRFAHRIGISFRETAGHLGKYSKKSVFTGNPIRAELLRDDRAGSVRKFALDAGKLTILVIGGSQGAHRLNEAFIGAIAGIEKGLRGRLQVIHLTGVADYAWAVAQYEMIGIPHSVHSFVDRIEEAYSASDIIVTRSGASAIFEAAFFGRPMMLVPYPHAMNHQTENARVFMDNGAAIMLEEASLTADAFGKAISSLIRDESARQTMSRAARKLAVPEASDNLASQVLQLAQIS